MTTYKIQSEEKPRIGKHAEKAGQYALAVRLFNPIIDKGETLKIELYITGYGVIGGSKLKFFPSEHVFDENKSEIVSGLKFTEKVLTFGRQKDHMKPDGVNITFGGVKPKNWDEHTQYFDVTDDKPPVVATETKINSAPVELKLKTKKGVKSGKYTVQFYFTYFNGDEWKVSQESIQFTVRNVLQKYELAIVAIGVLAVAPQAYKTIAWLIKYFSSIYMRHLSSFFK